MDGVSVGGRSDGSGLPLGRALGVQGLVVLQGVGPGGSEKMGGKRCLCLSSKLSLYWRSRLGGSPTTFGASTSFCSVREIALRTAVDHARPP